MDNGTLKRSARYRASDRTKYRPAWRDIRSRDVSVRSAKEAVQSAAPYASGCSHAHLVTIPGSVFFLPNEVPKRIADVILQAVGHAG
jgi:hypothetical protein